ncbi:MAG: hypothetical protein R6U25_12645 [Alkalispirochaeta sp.]
MADPFFLLTLTGSAIGSALYLTFRVPRRSAHPLRTRRRRTIGIPAMLTVAVFTAGAAVLFDGSLIVEWWRWAAALAGVALGYTWVVLLVPRWWRVPLVLLLAVPIVPAVAAWVTLPHPAEYLDLSCAEPALSLREDSNSPGANSRVGDPRGGDPTIALVRLDPAVGDDGSMALRILPAVHLAADGTQGGWQPTVQVGAADRVRIVVTLERYPPPLWWFPTGERVSHLSIATSEESAILRASAMGAAMVRITRLGEVISRRSVELVRPDRLERFLQPGVYTLEYSCRATDTGNV